MKPSLLARVEASARALFCLLVMIALTMVASWWLGTLSIFPPDRELEWPLFWKPTFVTMGATVFFHLLAVAVRVRPEE